ncbi:hypothetical protein TraAM80_07946 [Trypanosoma rangeli]|uniref:Uncharacterized protein n=1 Tax=Trypanosoma rangeli TaxID=5698 RepID=A0A3R7NB42_TRYRA|nr:uncharacterized protein TraAM80_07946 [Trypanosoma rangeli]RNE99821.1 hypothetical protein TraAM80_07946 [Trypanosoma rangeli]|eukprot:RNE99821.1 hypothetical protein TraAM80_07946 [Trypanosoma rangeli]
MYPFTPTSCTTEAMSWTRSRSPLALMVATFSSIVMSFTGRRCFCRLLRMTSKAKPMPCLRSMGLAPVATLLWPSAKILQTRIVAVVVLSPATSFVLTATCRIKRAPTSSN